MTSNSPVSANVSIRRSSSALATKTTTPSLARSPRETENLRDQRIEVQDQGVSTIQREQLDAIEEAWARQLIATFDGGGIRGYSSLILLAALMTEVARIERQEPDPHTSSFSPSPRPENRHHSPPPIPHQSQSWLRSVTGLGATQTVAADTAEGGQPSPVEKEKGLSAIIDLDLISDYLPCHYLDYSFGTSTGGLISIMLGRFRMSVPDCLRRYEEMGERIFGHPRRISIKGWPKNKFDKLNLKQCVEDITNQHMPEHESQETYGRLPYPEDLCKTAVTTHIVSNRTAKKISEKADVLLRSYDHEHRHGEPLSRTPMSPGKATRFFVWQVARATAAAQFIFKEIEIDGDIYVDGAWNANNPVRLARQELNLRHYSLYASNAINICVSFGTGLPEGRKNHARRPGVVKLYRLIGFAAGKALACESEHDAAERDFATAKPETLYYRFNTGIKVGKTKTGEWEQKRKDGGTTLDYLARETAVDLATPEMRERLHECARELVDQRRLRTKDVARWTRFATCSTFLCEKCGECFRLSIDLRKHLLVTHPDCEILRQNNAVQTEYLASRERQPRHPYPFGPV